MGKANAEKAFRGFLSEQRPTLVLTCGFAGGLKPELRKGSVIFNVDPETELSSALLAAGAKPGAFHCATHVATTAAEKMALHKATSADAVEMESGVIRDICRATGIPAGTIRVILDSAEQDLPLDFNKLMTLDHRIDYGKLSISILKSPWKIPALLRLQKEGTAAAQQLAKLLNQVLLSRTSP